MLIKNRPEFKTKSAPLSFLPETTVFEAVQEMSARNFGSVIVQDKNGKLLGIVTERDLMKRVLAKNIDQHTTVLSDIMTKDIKVAHEEDNIYDWLRQMSNERFRHLPVVDDSGKVVQILSQGDFVSYTWPELIYQIKTEVSKKVSLTYQPFLIVSVMFLYVLIIWVMLK